MKIIAKIKLFVKKHEQEIILFLTVFLISMLAFSLGVNFSKENQKEPIKIEKLNYEINSSCHHS